MTKESFHTVCSTVPHFSTPMDYINASEVEQLLNAEGLATCCRILLLRSAEQ